MAPKTPEECDALFAEHVNAGRLDDLVALYEPRGSLVNQDGSVATGHGELREALGALVGMSPRLRMNVHRVVRAGDDLAVLYNDWTLSAKGPDGTPVEMAGKAIEIVRRQTDGTWRFAVDDPFARG
ncbi:MAG TPA: nuclear transport factor 2 family protein [Candidatus Binatia bacterium]|nr:nuclear transport factor 2 family protein [Candidatus Binatia bacterium]